MSLQIQISRREERAAKEPFRIRNLGSHPIFSPFEVSSPSGRQYRVVLRSMKDSVNSCTCPDFLTNLLGTCKHIEAVRHRLRQDLGKRLEPALADAPALTHVYLSYKESIDVAVTPVSGHRGHLREIVRRHFDPAGMLVGDPATRLPAFRGELSRLPGRVQQRVVVSPEVAAYAAALADKRAVDERRQWFLGETSAGRRTFDLVGTRLYPYQEQGVLHLAFGGRAMLADEMGLGKTLQALAATVLLKELRGISRVLIVCPASLKHQWQREIRRFTSLPVEVVGGLAAKREMVYRMSTFFTVINYELVMRDADVFERMAPDLVILDEAQRIKNWRTKTAQAVKRLRSRYAFVLTGTPLENNLDDVYSIMQFLDPRLLGPLWQFNRRYFLLEQKKSGTFRVLGHKNLDELRRRIGGVVLRRTRDEVQLELPDRIDNDYFVEMTTEQLEPYEDYRSRVARLAAIAEKRALAPHELKRLQMCLQKMRVLCDALELHDPKIPENLKERTSPKLAELARIFEDNLVGNDRKAIVFSSFEGMIDLAIRRVARPRELGHVKLSGSVPTGQRGSIVDRFRDDPACRVFFSTDAGGLGLNLQAASLVINLDVPWNPAVLDQRIGRAHRLGQSRKVNVVNLVAQGTIEERILDVMATKREVFAGVFAREAPDEIVFGKSRGVLARLREIVGTDEPPAPAVAAQEPGLDAGEPPPVTGTPAEAAPGAPAGSPASGAPPKTPAELALRLAARLEATLPGRVLLVRTFVPPAGLPDGGREQVLVVVDRDPSALVPSIDECARDLDGDGVRLAVFDRSGYLALLGLLGSALEAPGQGQEAFRSPSLPRIAAAPDPQMEERERRVKEARAAIDRAADRLRMAQLLVGSGFATDALSPLSEALDGALASLLTVAGERAVAGTAPSPLVIERALVRPGRIDADLAARIPWARGLSAPGAAAAGAPEPELLGKVGGVVSQILDAARTAVTAETI